LTGLTSLQFLNLTGCGQLSGDLTPLASLTSLQSLDLSGCDQLSDLSPLAFATEQHLTHLGEEERAKHIGTSFDAALYGLKNDVLMMSSLTDRIFQIAFEALLNRNSELCDRTAMSVRRPISKATDPRGRAAPELRLTASRMSVRCHVSPPPK
jgi:hypothetical protein